MSAMPLEPDEPQSEQVNARISPSMLTMIDDYAKDEDRTRSQMIRRLLAEAIAARQGGKRR